MGDRVERVRRAEICAKQHLTFAFFSPRVCVQVGQVLLRQKFASGYRTILGGSAAEAIYGANKTAKGSPGLPGFV
jgi:hypothetical protein